MTNNQIYIDYLVLDYIKPRMDLYFKDDCNTVERIIEKHYVGRLKNSQGFRRFQEFYFKATGNPEYFNSDNFIIDIKKYYSIQGITAGDLNRLKKYQSEIVDLILQDNIIEAYFKFFYSLNGKNYGSFFTKIAHTVAPDKYCPVDIPIREYFNLKNENYIFSMLALSNAFTKWSDKNQIKIRDLKSSFINETIEYFPNISANLIADKMNAMKILNIIFWSLSINNKNKTT